MSKCSRCAHQPQGIEGHTDLFTYSMGGQGMSFRCQACGSMWMRRYKGEGLFLWLDAPDGDELTEIPGRRNLPRHL